MNTILLTPTDILFFRDGRPMEGSLSGHGASWPLPTVLDSAFHAALHRSGLAGHNHDHRRANSREKENSRRFGSLAVAGPFPVHQENDRMSWFFPRPLDLLDHSVMPALLPTDLTKKKCSSLPDPLVYGVANRLPPSKDSTAKAWLCRHAYQRYLDDIDSTLDPGEAIEDFDFSDSEASIGIEIDPNRGTAGQGDVEGKIYSAQYLRLREKWQMGVFAKTSEKSEEDGIRQDLIPSLIQENQKLLVGGQQRSCTAKIHHSNVITLPLGKNSGFNRANHKYLVKWILLSPAIWPEIPCTTRDGREVEMHHGGWLPNWVQASSGLVMLKSGKRNRRNYTGKHTRGYSSDAQSIQAKLVAAVVPKAIPVTGWAFANQSDRIEGGAKSTHLAVPAGAVYYFETDNEEEAVKLANALNWHGDTPGTEIRNRRSTLMGEKGFGLGVCGTWKFFPGTEAS